MTGDRIKSKRAAYRRGRVAEVVAAGVLVAKGFKILARRFKCASGEIDLIARRGQLVVFVEVKTRASLDDAAYAITQPQQRRIVNAAREWLAVSPFAQELDLRFDAILLGKHGGLRHIKGAFESDA